MVEVALCEALWWVLGAATQTRRSRGARARWQNIVTSATENHSQLKQLDLSKPANSLENMANWTYAPAKSLILLNALLNIIHVMRMHAFSPRRCGAVVGGRIGQPPPWGGAVAGACIYKNTHTPEKFKL